MNAVVAGAPSTAAPRGGAAVRIQPVAARLVPRMGLLAPPLAWLAGRWVARQRALHRPAAEPLAAPDRRRLAAWFGPATLERVRVRRVEALEAPFARALRRIGVPLPLEIDRILGIAFVDTIVVLDRVGRQDRLSLLFHELVHVVQYRRLGAAGFLRRYVEGWIEEGRRYAAIPLEREAYALQARFEAGEAFDVESEIDFPTVGAAPPDGGRR